MFMRLVLWTQACTWNKEYNYIPDNKSSNNKHLAIELRPRQNEIGKKSEMHLNLITLSVLSVGI